MRQQIIICESALPLAESPGIGVAVSLIQGVQLLIPLLAGKADIISKFEEVGSHIDQPLRVDGANLSHVLFWSEDQLVVNDPFRFLVEEGTAGVNVYLMFINEGSVASLIVFACGMEEETWDDCLPDQGVIFTTAFDG